MKNQHGGKREGAGPKTLPKGECKKIVVIYLEQDHIDEWGGKKKLQADIKKFVYRELQKGKCQIHKDEKSVRVKCGKGLPIWYPSETVFFNDTHKKGKASTTNKGSNVSNVKAQDEAVRSEDIKPGQEADVKPIEQEKQVFTKNQAKALDLLQKSLVIGGSSMSEKMILPTVQCMPIMKGLESLELVEIDIIEGEFIYKISEKGKKADITNIKKSNKAGVRGTMKPKIIELIGKGLTNKEIIKEVGCDPSYITRMRDMLYIIEEHIKYPNMEDEEFAKKIGKTLFNVKYFRPKN